MINQLSKGLSLCLILLTILSCSERADQSNLEDQTENKIDSLLSLMTIDEKIGQLTLFTSDYDVTGPTMREGYIEDIKSGKVGAIFNAYGVDYTTKLQKIAIEETRLGIPLLFGYDVIHGHKTIFPISLGESSTWDLALIEKAARIAAIEASAEGLHWTFAPMVDISRDPRWGRVSEGSGEDTYLGAAIAKARVRGFQGSDLKETNTILATAKHFAAYGAALAGRDYNTVDMSDRVLRETYLPPFKAALDEGVATFMTSFNEVDGIPASGSKYLLNDILRDEWKFNGFVVTDYTSINEMIAHGFSTDLKNAAEQAINAGVDMDMQGAAYYDHLKELVSESKVSEKTIDQAVRNVLRMKFKLGLFDDPYRYSNKEREQSQVFTKEHLESAREVARASQVLLKNDNVLPISKDVKTIALIGPMGNNRRDLIGSWSAAGDWSKAVTLLEGIKEKLGSNTKIIQVNGSDVEGNDQSEFNRAIAAARNADVVILALGENYWMSGEAASRSNLDLPGVQKELAEAVLKVGKPTVTVLMNGRPLTIEWLDNSSDAILETWFAGTQAGHAIADVLFGDYNPSGKLTMSFPRNVGQIPIFYNNKNTGRPMTDEKYTSKYLDVSNDPLYPFGFGLSYTSFEYNNLKLSADKININDSLKVIVDITNTGDLDGEEVVQLYIQDLVGSVTRPVKELKGFQKIALNSGETKSITFTITEQDLAFYTASMDFKAEAGEFKIFVGGNSRDVIESKFTLNK
ncbi:beta-glucosidase BglX [Penaeicola halotolerans]|uniref:beta-glucosidase BglX n=1 Tax=Penaeicola halotolerans TaxID=2793196 RepID=UPI001CF92D1D|nr:beta-glucosidase BglX [Penaeicola halotolerans]